MRRRVLTVVWLFVSLTIIAMWALEFWTLALRITVTALDLGYTAGIAWWAFQNDMKRIVLVPGVCRSCGYDLRATPDRCPECGMPTEPNHTAIENGIT